MDDVTFIKTGNGVNSRKSMRELLPRNKASGRCSIKFYLYSIKLGTPGGQCGVGTDDKSKWKFRTISTTSHGFLGELQIIKDALLTR